MKMYKDYLEERYPDSSLVYSDKGYLTYHVRKEEIYIEDLYVKPEFRKDRVASELADQVVDIAKEKGKIYLTGSVIPSMKNSTTSEKVLLGYGFKLLRSSDDFIEYYKEI